MERRFSDHPFWKRRNGKITLSPHARLALVTRPAARRTPERVSWVFSPEERHHLAALLDDDDAPRPAHELVSALRALRRTSSSDRRIIEGFQHLIERGIVVVDEAREPGD